MERLWRVMDHEAAAAPKRRSRPAHYILAAALVGAGLMLRFLLQPFLGDRSIFLFFVPAVLFGAAVDGLGAGLLATGLGAICGAAMQSSLRLNLDSLVDVALFAGLGAAISLGGRQLQEVRRKAEASTLQVTEREAYLQSVLDTIPDAMVVIDEHGVIESFSPAAERMFGWSAAEIVGSNVSRLMPNPDREAHDGYLDHYLRTGERKIIGRGRVVLAERRDGATFPIELAIGEMRAVDHRFFTGFMIDLTEQQQTELRLRSLQAELVHISRLSAMGEMAATLAHELNQPLSAISNYLNGSKRMLETGGSMGRVIEAIDKASEQALRAGQVIRHLRDFIARGESRRLVESLPKLLDEASALALIGARERGVRVQVDRDPEVDAVRVDKVQIEQVIVNLMRNGIEAMDGAPRRELLITIRAADPDTAEVRIADTGSGLDPAIAADLFKPFVTTKGLQGMGIGLSICRTIIEAHGGRIWAEPREGGGTVFGFTLPRVADQGIEA